MPNVWQRATEPYEDYLVRVEEAREANRLRYKDYFRENSYRKKYGISRQQYNEMVEAQHGKCAMCGKEETALDRAGALKPLSIDHDHDTGKVRALLCYRCNLAVGYVEKYGELVAKYKESLSD